MTDWLPLYAYWPRPSRVIKEIKISHAHSPGKVSVHVGKVLCEMPPIL